MQEANTSPTHAIIAVGATAPTNEFGDIEGMREYKYGDVSIIAVYDRNMYGRQDIINIAEGKQATGLNLSLLCQDVKCNPLERLPVYTGHLHLE